MGAAVVEGVEVLSCPHCGSEAQIKTDNGAPVRLDGKGKGIPGSHKTSWFWVKCSNKDCAASHASKPTAEEAAAIWSQRA